MYCTVGPSSDTLSKALDISKKFLSWTIKVDRYSHESEGHTPHWFSDSKLFSLIYLNIKLKRTLSKIVQVIQSKVLVFFYFFIYWNSIRFVPNIRENSWCHVVRKYYGKDALIAGLIFIIFTDKLSWPCALLISRPWIILIKSSLSKIISLRQVIELKFTDISKVLSLFACEHFEAKSLLKWSTFFFKVWFWFIIY